MFETSVTFNEEFLKTIKHYLFPVKNKIVMCVCCTVLLAYMFMGGMLRNVSTVTKSFLGIIILVFAYYFVINKNVNDRFKKMVELSNGKSNVMCTRFNEESIDMFYPGNDEAISVSYMNLEKLIQTEKFFLIYTKASHLIVVFYEQLSNQEKAEFIPFIKSKAPQIKINKCDIIKILNWFINIVITIATIFSLIFFISQKAEKTFSEEMAELTDKNIKNIYTEINQDNVTAAIFDTFRSDDIPEVADMIISYRTIIHHIGYIVKQEGKIVESNFLEMGPILSENEYYILPIEATGQCLIAVALPVDHIKKVFYLGESVEYAEYKVEGSEAIIWCSFLVRDLEVDVNNISIEY